MIEWSFPQLELINRLNNIRLANNIPIHQPMLDDKEIIWQDAVTGKVLVFEVFSDIIMHAFNDIKPDPTSSITIKPTDKQIAKRMKWFIK